MPSTDNRLAAVVEEVLADLRVGKQPQIEELRLRHPSLAIELSELLPTLLELEQARSVAERRLAEKSAAHDTEELGPDSPPLGDFQIVREIGRGGMGVVYEAVQESLRRRVALKILPAWAARSPRHVQRFQREALSAANLHHTNIVPVLGVGEARGLHYLVMQLIEGRALDEILANGRQNGRPDLSGSLSTGVQDKTPPVAAHLPTPSQERREHPADHWRRIARIGLQAAEALQYAYTQGLVHRDIKPSNIILDGHGTAWVADFGLAKLADSVELTLSGELLGTLRYMPPERLRGQADIRGDVYGLGATLYELATQRPPFTEDEQAVLLKQVSDVEPPRPRSIEPEIPRDLETIVVKAMAKEPAHRYATPGALADDLRRFLDDRPIAARRASQAERLWRWCRKHPGVAIPSALSLLLLMLITFGSTYSAAQLRLRTRRAEAAESRAVEAELSRRQELFRAHLANARGAAIKRGPGQRLDGLQAIQDALAVLPKGQRTAEQEFELLDAAIPCLANSDVRERHRSRSSRWIATECDVAPDFSVIAEADETMTATRLVPLSGTPRSNILLSEPSPTFPPISLRRFSRGGRWLIEQSVSTVEMPKAAVRIHEVNTSRGAIVPDVMLSASSFDFHPDERRLTLANVGNFVQTVDLETGQVQSQSPPRFRGGVASYSGDGRWLAIGGANGPAEVVDPTTWETRDALTAAGPVTALAFDPQQSQYLTLGTATGELYTWDTAARAGQFRAPVAASAGDRDAARIESLHYSTNGALLAINLPGRAQIRRGDEVLVELPGEVLRFSADGSHVAYVVAGQELVVADIESAASFQRTPCDFAEHVSVSPDDRLLAVSGPGGVHLVAADTFADLGSLGLDHCGPVAFEPGGKSLVTFGTFSQACRWPIQEGAAGWQIGPPQPILYAQLPDFEIGPIAPQHQACHAAFGADGTLALADYRHGQVLVTKDHETPRIFAAALNVAHVALSPDGKWIAGAARVFPAATVWDARDGKQVLYSLGATSVAFSADGRWLAAAGVREVRLFDSGDWSQSRQIAVDVSELVAFQPGSSLLATLGPYGHVDLIDANSARRVAHLPHLGAGRISGLAFSSNGRRLYVARRGVDISVWDLGTLQQELCELGLAPSVPLAPAAEMSAPAPDATGLAAPQTILVDRGALPADDRWYRCWRRLALDEADEKLWPDAIANVNRAIQILPPGHDAELVELLNLRGLYHDRNGDFLPARDTWERALQLDVTTDAAARSLIRLYLLGPAEVRSPERATALARLLDGPDRAEWAAVVQAIAAIRSGKAAEGLRLFSEMVVPADWQPEAAYFRALALHAMGDAAGAVAELDRAMDIDREAGDSIAIERRAELDRLQHELSQLVNSPATPAAPAISQ